MRCYHFGNYYMSSIQQGIQAAHCQMELFVKYEKNLVPNYTSVQKQFLYNWAENHKTMVCLNGGNLQGLKNIETLLQREENKFPWSTFYEDEESLGGILTNVAIILPESIYDTAAKIRSGEYVICVTAVLDKDGEFVLEMTEFEIKLIALLNSCQLAR